MPVPAAGAASKASPPPASAPVAGASSSLLASMASDRATIGAPTRLLVAPNASVFLRHNPRCWEIDTVEGEVEGVKLDGAYWLPEVLLFPLTPGSNGVRTRQTNEPPETTFTDAVFSAEKKGWVFLSDQDVIPARYLPPGVPEGTYRRTLACQSPEEQIIGVYYCEPWKVPVEGIPGDRQRFQWHRESYNLWRASLVITGKIRPPTKFVLEEVATRLRARVDRVMILDLPEDVRQRKIKAAEAQAAQAEKAGAPARVAS